MAWPVRLAVHSLAHSQILILASSCSQASLESWRCPAVSAPPPAAAALALKAPTSEKELVTTPEMLPTGCYPTTNLRSFAAKRARLLAAASLHPKFVDHLFSPQLLSGLCRIKVGRFSLLLVTGKLSRLIVVEFPKCFPMHRLLY